LCGELATFEHTKLNIIIENHVILRLQNLLSLLTAYFQGTKVTRLAAFLFFVAHGFVLAAEPESAFSLSGFGNLAVGKILRGTSDPATNLGYGCPCYIADYAQNAVYEGKVFRFKPDSKLGLQGQWNSPEKQYSVTAQIISRGAANGNMNVEWLYGTAEINSNLTLQVGRKRLPLLQFSEVQDVSHALPWIHLPAQVYGWEIVNYNGANLRYRDEWKSWFINGNMFVGNETNKDAGFWKIYNGKYSKTSSKWSNIIGAEAKVSKGWFDARGFYMQSNTQNLDYSTSTVYSIATKQRISGLSLNGDFGKAFASMEMLSINRKADYGGDKAWLVYAGYRIGKFTPLISYAEYSQNLNDPTSAPEGHRTISGVLRYDINAASALKVQLDAWKDKSGIGFTSQHGNSTLLSISYDRVF
jgi:hypothetical protein